MEILLKFIDQLAGKQGGLDNIVMFTITGTLWAVLLFLAKDKQRYDPQPREAWLVWGFGIGLAREVFMFTMALLRGFGALDPLLTHEIFPPVEHALRNVAQIVVVAAFWRYLTGDLVQPKRYLKLACGAIVLVYLATFWWWAQFISANPTSKFGQVWCDWVFHITIVAMLIVPWVAMWRQSAGWLRNTVTLALGLVILSEFSKLPDMAMGERYEYIIAPISKLLHLFGIAAFGYVYVREQALAMRQSKATLQQNVQAATADLQESEERNRLVVENLREVVFQLDAQGLLTFVNPAWSRVTGFTREESLGASYLKFLDASASTEAQKNFDNLHTGKTHFFNRILRSTTKAGKPYFIDLYMAPVYHADGSFSHMQSSFADVTEKLESSKKLQTATAQALQAVKAKSAFLANMSHEIRTPMNGVIGMTSLLMSTQLNQEQQDFVKTIRVSGENLLVVINDILDFSKIEAGRVDLEVEPFDLAATVDDVLDLLMPSAKDKSLLLTCLIDPQVPRWLQGDVTRIRQVLVNLVSNAIKFTDRGEVHVSVRHLPAGGGKMTLEFCVRDTGIGMSAETMERVFTAFTQADSSTSRMFGGTGLGLAISLQLARLMDGDIRVESQLQGGSRFFFSMQTTAVPVMGDDTLGHATMVETMGNKVVVASQIFDQKLAQRVPLRILVVEDHEINQKVLVQMLQRFGYSMIDVAANGREAVDSMLRQQYDLVFMDEHMPVMDGLDATRAIIAQLGKGANKTIKPVIVALTADVMPNARSNCLAAGMDDYVSKPVSPQVLQTMIEKWGTVGKRSNGLTQHIQPAQAEQSVLDHSVTTVLLELDATGEWLRNLVKHYAQPDGELESAMRNAAAARSAKQMVSALHGLSGVSGTIGAQRVLALIKRIEGLCKEGHFADVEGWINQLAAARLQASHAFMALLPKVSASA